MKQAESITGFLLGLTLHPCRWSFDINRLYPVLYRKRHNHNHCCENLKSYTKEVADSILELMSFSSSKNSSGMGMSIRQQQQMQTASVQHWST
jgi:hypothetical protein